MLSLLSEFSSVAWAASCGGAEEACVNVVRCEEAGGVGEAVV